MGPAAGSGGADGFEFYDDTTAYSGPLFGAFTGTTVVLTLGSGGPAVDGDLVTVVVTPVTSPAKGSYSLGVSTSADPAGVSAAYKLA